MYLTYAANFSQDTGAARPSTKQCTYRTRSTYTGVTIRRYASIQQRWTNRHTTQMWPESVYWAESVVEDGCVQQTAEDKTALCLVFLLITISDF